MCGRRSTSSCEVLLVERLALAEAEQLLRGRCGGRSENGKAQPDPHHGRRLPGASRSWSGDRRRRKNRFQAPGTAITARAPIRARLAPVPAVSATTVTMPRRAPAPRAAVRGRGVCRRTQAPRRGYLGEELPLGTGQGRPVLRGSRSSRATGGVPPARPEPTPAVGRCWVYWSTAGGLATAAVAGAAKTATMTATQPQVNPAMPRSSPLLPRCKRQ